MNLTPELSIIIVGLLAVLMWSIMSIGNVASAFAGMLLGLSIIILLFSFLFGIGMELFWLALIGTTVMIIVSMAVRVMV